MAIKDYYRVLDVAPDASLEAIRRAFRRLALEHHPDRAGEEGAARFREALEAYEVLSDPEARARYDRERRLREAAEPLFGRSRRSSAWAEPLLRRGPQFRAWADPLAGAWAGSRRSARRLFASPLDLGAFEHVFPSLDALFDRVARATTGYGRPKGGGVETLTVEVVVSPQQARRGGIVEVSVPVFARCGWCDGSGRELWSLCRACGGRGVRGQHVAVPVSLAAGVRDGDVFEVSLAPLGIDDLYLRILVRVSPWAEL